MGYLRANSKWPAAISALAIFGTILSLATSMWRLWNWPILSAIINARIAPIIPQIHATDRGVLIVFGQSGPQLLSLAALACAAAVLAMRRARPISWYLGVALLPCLLVILLALFSISWSVAPGNTRAQVLPFATLTVAVLILGMISTEEEILTALEIFSIGVIVASLFALLRYYEGATMVVNKSFAWRGIFVYKNNLGLAMALANAILLLRLFAFRSGDWPLTLFRLGMYAVTLLMLFMSNTMTSLVSLIAIYLLLGLALAYLKWGEHLKRKHWVLVTAATIAGFILLWAGRRPILGLFGRTPELTGRLPLWALLATYVAERPFLGYGFGQAFWRKYGRAIVLGRNWLIVRGRGWRPGQAHNMFMEFALSLGLIGLALVLIMIAETLVLGLRHFLRARSIRAIWPLLLLALVVLVGMAESFVTSHTYFLWALVVLSFGFVLRAEFARAEPPPASAEGVEADARA
jgi:exopolysaccharide production protein ExoQ